MRRPKNITYHQKDRNLELTYEDFSWKIAAELLRLFSPSDEVRGHGPHERKIQAGKKYIAIKRIDPTGLYIDKKFFHREHCKAVNNFNVKDLNIVLNHINNE